MSTMICVHIEYKKDGRWLHYAAPHAGRIDYRLMALIAGVRNENNGIRPMLPPRGLPDGISEVTAVCHAEDNKNYKTRSETWYSGDELFELQERWNELADDIDRLGKDFEERVFHVYGPGGSAIASHQGFDDARAVFWFYD